MKLFLLDRNVVIHIAEGFKRRPPSDAAKIKHIDKVGNTVSFMLSSLEGNEGIPQTPTGFFDGAVEELEKTKDFFKHAKFDSNFIKKNLFEASLALTQRQAEAYAKHKEMTEFLQDKLYQNVSTDKLNNTRELILAKSLETGTPISHPIALAGLSALYGYDPARRALKCKQPTPNETEIDRSKRTYNAISDLMTISNIAIISDTVSRSPSRPNSLQVKFITFDRDLDKIISKIKIKKISSREDMAGDRDTYTEYTPCMSLFPRLNDKGKNEFIDWMNKHSPKSSF